MLGQALWPNIVTKFPVTIGLYCNVEKCWNMVSEAVQVPVVTRFPNSWKNKQTMNIFKYFSWSFKILYKKKKCQKEIVNFLISSYYKICFLTFLDTWNQVLGAVTLFFRSNFYCCSYSRMWRGSFSMASI